MKDEKSNFIMTSARKLFSRYGLRKTTVDEIAKEAHVGKGTVYNYFRSKEEVFKAVVEEEAKIFRNELKKAVSSEPTPEKKLRAYVTRRMYLLRQLANFYSTFKDEYINYYGFLEKVRAKYTNEEMATIKQILKEGTEKRIFLIRDLDLTAFAVVIAMKGLEYYWAMETDPLVTEKKIDTLLKIFLEGILRR